MIIKNNRFNAKIIGCLILASIAASCSSAANNTNVKSTNSISSTNSANQTTAKTAATDRKTSPAKYEDKRTEMHHRLDPLIGEWSVEKSNSIVSGSSAEKPLVSKDSIICRREWIEKAGSYFIKDETEGKFGNFDYYRLGILGYSTPDDRYALNTVDNFNPMMMTYKGEKNSGQANKDISIIGEYTDQGFLGKEYVGKTIAQRTGIRIESTDRHIFELYFKPPGEKESIG